MKFKREVDTRTNEDFCKGLRNMELNTSHEAADRIEALEAENKWLRSFLDEALACLWDMASNAWEQSDTAREHLDHLDRLNATNPYKKDK